METQNINNTEKLPEISSGEFNQLISQISGSSEFNKMIGNLTSNLQNSFSNLDPNLLSEKKDSNLNDDKISDSDRILEEALEEIDTDSKNDSLDEREDLVDILGLFFADQNGNNICETLIKMNKNFEKDLEIKEKLYNVICQKWNISDNEAIPEIKKNFDEY
jgi:hypothetical protein